MRKTRSLLWHFPWFIRIVSAANWSHDRFTPYRRPNLCWTSQAFTLVFCSANASRWIGLIPMFGLWTRTRARISPTHCVLIEIELYIYKTVYVYNVDALCWFERYKSMNLAQRSKSTWLVPSAFCSFQKRCWGGCLCARFTCWCWRRVFKVSHSRSVVELWLVSRVVSARSVCVCELYSGIAC